MWADTGGYWWIPADTGGYCWVEGVGSVAECVVVYWLMWLV